MKRNTIVGLLLALCLVTVSSASLAEQLIPTTPRPTTTIATIWNEYQTTDGGLNNANAWANVWLGDGKVGFYVYTQTAQPSFSQVYGGLAGRAFNGSLEGGVGLGSENVDGHIGLRRSAYVIAVRGRFSAANWYESSKYCGWWMLSQNMFAVTPAFEAGYRMQRYLGGGPMVRYTATVKRLTFQPYAVALFDGDRVNPIIAMSLTFK